MLNSRNIAYFTTFVTATLIFYPIVLDSNAYKVPVYNQETNQVSLAFPSYQYELKRAFAMISLAFSIGGSSPLFLDYIYDKLFRRESLSLFDSYVSSIRRIALCVVTVDIIFMVILIPQELFNILLLLLLFRDILFTFEFLMNLNMLFPEAFNIWLVLGTSGSFALANHMELIILQNPDSVAPTYAFTTLVITGFSLFLALCGRWISFIMSNTDKSLESKILLCNVYVGTFFLFICGEGFPA